MPGHLPGMIFCMAGATSGLIVPVPRPALGSQALHVFQSNDGMAIMMKALASLAFLVTTITGVMAQNASPTVIKELAPTGKLRVAINYGNVVLAQKLPNGEAGGVSGDLAHELAKRLGVPLEVTGFDAAGKVTDAAKQGGLDIVFLAIDPVRGEGIEFTGPYVVIEGAYMVPDASPLKANEDVDRAGVRIAAAKGSAYDLYLTRHIKNATIARQPSGPEAFKMFTQDKLEAAAGVKQPVIAYAKATPGVRVLPGRFMVIEQAMGTMKGRPEGSKYLHAFVEEMKASGFVQASLTKSHQNDAAVAPPSPAK